MLVLIRVTTAIVWLVATPALVRAQRPGPVFSPNQGNGAVNEVWMTHRNVQASAFGIDSLRGRDRTPFVVGGAVVGAIVGRILYRQVINRIDESDFEAYALMPLFVVGGVAGGALLGFIIGSFGDPPRGTEGSPGRS